MRRLLIVAVIISSFLITFKTADSAGFNISPSRGSFDSGQRFVSSVSVNTEGDTINAAEGTLIFDSRYLNVENVSTNVSIFKFWAEQPAFSNVAGTINFSGGLPSPGYSGSSGQVLNITFKAISPGTSLLGFNSGAILVNDGQGTNIYTSSEEAEYTVESVAKPQPAEPIEAPVEVSEELSPEPVVSLEPPIESPVITFYSEEFNYPKSPLVVRGTAPANVTVILKLYQKNKDYTFNARSDSSGSWKAVLKEEVPSGKYFITAKAIDEKGTQSSETNPVVIECVRANTWFIIGGIILLVLILLLLVKKAKPVRQFVKKSLRKLEKSI